MRSKFTPTQNRRYRATLTSGNLSQTLRVKRDVCHTRPTDHNCLTSYCARTSKFRSPVNTLSQRAQSPHLQTCSHQRTPKPKNRNSRVKSPIRTFLVECLSPQVSSNTEYVVLTVMHLVIRIVNHLPHTASLNFFQSHFDKANASQ